MQIKNNYKLAGVNLVKSNNGVYLCYIENFSDEIKEEIRKMLSGIWHGVVSSQENQEIHNYQNTIRDFLDRYNNQPDNTQKGIIGELLTHILIPNYISDLEVVSIMKNKEERSIKKGFDIVYSNNALKNIWYCEVKSGGDKDNLDINKKNNERLNAAKSGLKKMVNGNRTTIWDSVINDIHLTIFNSDKKINITNLLKMDHPYSENRNINRNVILSSVLYKNLDTRISLDKLKTYKSNIDHESIFIGLVVFSIQKPTYKKIVNFLIQESNTKNDR